MSNYDNWKSTTPEDEENDRSDREDAARERIERLIDGKEPIQHKGIDRSHDFDYDPYNP